MSRILKLIKKFKELSAYRNKVEIIKKLLLKRRKRMSLKEGVYKIYTLDSYLDNSRKCITVKNRSKEKGSDIILSSNLGSDKSQYFAIRKDGENYIIQSMHSFLVLEVCGETGAEGTKVVQSPYTGTKNQKWKFKVFELPHLFFGIVKLKTGYFIQTCMNGFSLKVGDYETIINHEFHQEQIFVLEEVE